MVKIKGQLRGWNPGMENTKNLLVTGLVKTLAVVPCYSIFAIVGVYPDGKLTAPLQKYADESVAKDVAQVIMNRAKLTTNN